MIFGEKKTSLPSFDFFWKIKPVYRVLRFSANIFLSLEKVVRPDWLSCSSPIYVIILDFIRSRTIYKWYVKPFAYWNWCIGSPWKRIIRMCSGTCSKYVYAYAHIIIKEFKGIRCLYISIFHWLNYRFRTLLYSLMYFLYSMSCDCCTIWYSVGN